MLSDVVTQRLAGLETHHQIYGFVGAEEIQHANHIGVVQAGKRAAFFEKKLQAMIEVRLVLGRDVRRDLSLGAQRQRIGHVLLDSHRGSGRVMRQVDDGKATDRKLSFDAVAFQLAAGRQGMVVLGDQGRIGAGRLIYCCDFPCSSACCKPL